MTATLAARARLADTDARGCVSDISLLVLFEAARADALREIGLPYAEIVARGVNALTVQARLANHESAGIDDLLVVHTTTGEVGRVRFSFVYEVRRQIDDVLIASGETVHIFIETERGQPGRVPDWFVDGLKQLRDTGPT